jgi:HrpA-like RNA helicase
MSSLEDCLVSRANARQRRGRAGRVREGVAVHLFTRHRHDRIANGAQPPEIKRVPLEQLILRIKALKYEGTAADVCARLVEPPTPTAVSKAVEELVFLEAINDSEGQEALTALGVHLSTLPVDCRIGKLILLGAMFGVCDEALTIAATLSYRSPFNAPMMKRDEADRAKMQFATGQSDHLTMLRAYQTVDKMGSARCVPATHPLSPCALPTNSFARDRYDFCRENFLSIKSLQTIAGLKRQFLELLSAAGFVRFGLRSRGVESMGRRVDGSDGVKIALEQGLQFGQQQQSQLQQMYGQQQQGGGGAPPMQFNQNTMPGDWMCPAGCGNNFARNLACFRCRAPKPQELIEAEAARQAEAEAAMEERRLNGNDQFERDSEAERNEPLLKVSDFWRACERAKHCECA